LPLRSSLNMPRDTDSKSRTQLIRLRLTSHNMSNMPIITVSKGRAIETQCLRRILRKSRRINQTLRLDSKKIHLLKLKKDANEELEEISPTKLILLQVIQLNKKEMLGKEESDKRTKMKIHKSSKKLVLKKSRVRRELSSTSTKSKLILRDNINQVKDVLTQWPPRMKTCRSGSRWVSLSPILKSTSLTVTCFFSPQKRRKMKKVLFLQSQEIWKLPIEEVRK